MADSSDEGDSNSNQQGNVPQDKNWEWIACVYDMKRSTADSEITWNLSPSIMLTLPSEQNFQPKVDLIIESSKSFIFSEGLQWNWHKSWNIPDIHCTLDIRDPQTNEKLLPPSKIYAEIYVVRAVINQIHTFHLVDVGIKGENRSEFESSRCVFTGLKFDTTSYNHEGSKFHLVIVVYLNQNKFEHPKILESRISPPIFVDSRKSARDTQQQKAQKLSSFIDPFLPDSLDKKFVKRESKKKSNADESIDNTIEGLSNFFSAPNIRHKVKHPLFLAIKFSSCVKIYFNTNIIPCNNNNEKFVEVMQKQLMEAYNRSSQNTNMNIEDKPLILTIEHPQQPQNFKQKKQISEFLDPLHGDVLHVMIDSMNIPSNFKKLEDIEGVKDAYKKVYSKISQQKFSNSGDEDESAAPKKKRKGKQEKEGNKNKKNEESEGSDDDEEQEEAQPNKKIKPNEMDSSQVNQVFDSKKMQIKNPAQQSEIVLNSATSNNASVTNMILQGAKPTQSKIQKPGTSENDQAASSPQITSKTDISAAAAKATKGKAKRAGKNAQPVTAQNEPANQQQLPISAQQPQQPIVQGQISLNDAQNQNLNIQRQQDQKGMPNGFPPLSLNQGIDAQQRQLSQTKIPGQSSFPSQQTYQQPQIPSSAGFGASHLQNSSRQEFENTLKPMNDIQGGYQFQQQGYYPQGQIAGNQVGFNGMIPGSSNSSIPYPHHLSQQNHGYAQTQHNFSSSQLQLPNGSIPQSQQQQQYMLSKHPSIQNLQQRTKEIYDESAGVNLPNSFKQPGLGQENTPTVPEINDQAKPLTLSAAHQQYSASQPVLQNNSQITQYGAVTQQQGQPLPPFSDTQYPRNSSQSFTNISQQTRFPPGLPSKASIGSLNTSIQQQPQLQQQGQSHFYDQQGVTTANHFAAPNSEQTGPYLNGYNGQYQMPSQLNTHPNNNYPEDDDQFSYQNSQFNRFQAGQQSQQQQHGGQMPYNQGVTAPHDAQFGYYGYQQQQQQGVPGHAYGYNQQNLDGFQAGDHPGQQQQQMQYFKQGMNPQFQQYYPSSQQQVPLDLLNPLPPQAQQYPQGDSLQRGYYPPSNAKEDEY